MVVVKGCRLVYFGALHMTTTTGGAALDAQTKLCRELTTRAGVASSLILCPFADYFTTAAATAVMKL